MVLYDRHCRFCRVAARTLAAWDRAGRLGIVPMDHPLGAALMERVPAPVRGTALHLVEPSRVGVGEGAVWLALGRLPGGAVLRALGAHRAYAAIAGRRTRIGRLLPDLDPVVRPPSR